jgi:hypothetical protein
MRILYCGILIALLPCLALAQGVDIRGVVSDSSSGEPAPPTRSAERSEARQAHPVRQHHSRRYNQGRYT